MKNLTLVFFFIMGLVYANAQCTIDSTVQTVSGISPSPANMPCIIRSVPYDQTIQVKCPTYFDSTINFGIASYPVSVTVDSMELDSVIGLPNGISWVKNPNLLYGGQNGCLTFTGTTNDPTRAYHLLWYGTVWATLPSPVPAPYNKQTYTGVLNKMPWFDYYLDVINQGDNCDPAIAAGIASVKHNLNAVFYVYPNPNSGQFELRIATTETVKGEIVITDVTGRIVYSEKVETPGFYTSTVNLAQYAKGLYTVQLKTAEGFAAKNIIIQ